MTTATDKIAGAPISWGVCEVPGWGYQLSPDRVLAEMQQVGLAATEFGPDGFLPADPAVMADFLASRHLTAIGGFTPVVLHEHLGAGGVVAVEQPFDLRCGVVAGLVQHYGGEAADRGQVTGSQELGHDRRVSRQEPVGAELGGRQANLVHLGQDALGRELIAPAGHLAHAPGDGRARDLVSGSGHAWSP